MNNQRTTSNRLYGHKTSAGIWSWRVASSDAQGLWNAGDDVVEILVYDLVLGPSGVEDRVLVARYVKDVGGEFVQTSLPGIQAEDEAS